MAIYKFGSDIHFSTSDIKPTEIAANDDYIVQRFKKVAAQYKRIAPKANEFLYFSAIMMHAAERSLYDENGNLKKHADGSPVKGEWIVNDKGSWKWSCSDPSIKPYKNNNGDIFPESELKKAYRKWIGKPLCKDHQSSSVEGMRGLIIDTYYDDRQKCIIALCALDKVGYGQLARSVQTGIANSVSMGTAVGKSICTECGNIARTENEYCEHVSGRTAYGEINTELSPIELSLVVNGADPLARVRQIIATTTAIESTLKKSGNSTNLEQLYAIKEDVSNILLRVAAVEHELLSNKNDNNFALSATAANEAVTDTKQEYRESLNLIKNKISSIEGMIGKIASNFNTEELMSSQNKLNKEGYFQGTEEPTPGRPQYDKDPMAEQVRNNEDRQLKNVPEMGPVDGLYPGDVEKKRMLARAKVEERKELRAKAVAKAQEAIDKNAYMQGTTEPGKGGQTYKPDPLAEKVRKEDKQMFPADIKPDGMMAGDEKLKKQLNRASLKAYFVKAATPDGRDDTANHRWDITANNKVILTATLKELTGNKPALFGAVSSKEFGRELLKSVYSSGVEQTIKLYKSAQDVVPPPTEDPDLETPMESATMEPSLEEPAMDSDLPDEGPELKVVPDSVADPIEKSELAIDAMKENAETVAEVLGKLSDEIKDGFNVMKGEGVGGKEEMPQEGEVPMPEGLEGAEPEQVVAEALRTLEKNASSVEAIEALQKMQPVLKAGLMASFKNVYAEIKSAKDELDMVIGTLDIPGVETISSEFMGSLMKSAIKEGKAVAKKAVELQNAFVQYYEGSKQLESKAAIVQNLEKNAGKKMSPSEKASKMVDKAKAKVDKAKANADEAKRQYDEAKAALKSAKEDEKGGSNKGKCGTGKCGPEGVTMGKEQTKKAEFDMNTLEGRKNYRRKLAADALRVSEMLGRAHPSGSEALGQLDTKTNEAVVEDLPAVHSKMEELARKDPKVAKAAANAKNLNELIKSGRVKVANLDSLVANGMDAEAVAYWKKYYGQVDGGSDFASGLVADYENKKQAAVNEEELKIKIARAYDIAHEMREVGLIPNTREAVKSEVNRVIKWNDEAFETMRRVIANHRNNMKKTASSNAVDRIQNGIAMDNNILSGEGDKSLYELISAEFANHTFKNNF